MRLRASIMIARSLLAVAIGALAFASPLSAAQPPANRRLLPSQPLHIVTRDNGIRLWEIALDEFSIQPSDGSISLRSIPLQTDSEAVRHFALAQSRATGTRAGLVLYAAGQPRSAASRRIATGDVVISLQPDQSPTDLARDIQAEYLGELAYAPGFHRFRTVDAADALLAPETLQHRPGVQRVLPQLARLRVRTAIPNDTLYSQQWPLANSGQLGGTPGIDINVQTAWDITRGAGIVIGIVDDSLQLTHPDLAPNINTSLSHDFRDGDNDPSPNLVTPNRQDPHNEPSEDAHGTLVAGVAAGRGFNGIGICGVAPQAGIAGIRLIGDYLTDLQEADAIAHRTDAIAVKNNSWGPRDDGATLSGPDELALAALDNATATGRSGRGTVFVWSAGNGGEESDNANKNGYANSIYAIAVGAIDDDGRRASYSEPGCNILVCAPAGGSYGPGTPSTDLLDDDGLNFANFPSDLTDPDYTDSFLGTSSSAPMVSGLAALMLSANPNLGWRDVQEILIRTARKIDATSPAWFNNAAGFHFNDDYGAGLIDASAAVSRATTWTNLAAMRSTARAPSQTLPATIPDNSISGIDHTFDFSGTSLRVEHVQVHVFIDHPFRGDLECTLRSPAGTVSRLVASSDDDFPGYYDWTFSSVQHWGESAAGTWTLHLADRFAGDIGQLWQATVTLHGTETVNGSLPATPGKLTAQGVSTHEIEIAWEDRATNETGYQIEFAYGWGANWIIEATVPANTTRYTQRFIPQGAKPYYRVKALKGTMSSGYTHLAHALVQDGDKAIVFKTGFNTEEGYTANRALAGQDNWEAYPTSFVYPGNGVVADSFSSRGRPGLGQQARIGKSLSSGDAYAGVSQYLFYAQQGGTSIRLRTLLCLVASTNGSDDGFSFDLYNSDGQWLAEILFYNPNTTIYYATANTGGSYTDSHRTFVRGQVYQLEVSLDFINNRWSASLDNQTFATNIPFTNGSAGTVRDLGSLSLLWNVYNTAAPGNNYLLVDELVIDQIENTLPSPPTEINVVAGSASLLYLYWTENLLAESYEVQRSPNGINNWTSIATVAEDAPFYLDVGLEPATTYYYHIRSASPFGVSSYSGSFSATTFSEYQEWKDGYRINIDAADTFDDDRDGISLLMEYALATSPNKPSSARLPAPYVEEGRLNLTYYRARSDLIYSTETSTDLITWTTAGVTQEYETLGLYITASIPLGSAKTRFLRLVVRQP